MKDLTNRQQQVIQFLKQFTNKNGYSPSIREIAHHLNVSTKAAYDHLSALRKKQVIHFAKGKARAITFSYTSHQTQVIPIPLLSYNDLDAFFNHTSHHQPTLKLDTSLFALQGHPFALTLNPTLVQTEGFLNGDTLLFSTMLNPSQNTLILTVIDDHYYLKHFFNEGNRIKLQDTTGTLYTTNAKILGVLSGLIRKF